MNPKEKELLLCLALLAPTSASMMPAWASHPLPTASPIETVQTRERVAAGIVKDEQGRACCWGHGAGYWHGRRNRYRPRWTV